MKRYVPIVVLLACATIFAGTFFLLLKSRFEVGDVYPPSSSLRSDPLGTMILFESLQALPGVQTLRDFNAVNRLPPGQATTYLHFAAGADDWTLVPPELYRTLDQFLLEGGRLVITFKPEFSRKDEAGKKEPKKSKSDSEKEADKAKEKEERTSTSTWISLKEKWGLELFRDRNEARGHLVKNVSSLALPATQQWHGDLTLKDPDSSWTVIYQGDKGPVVAERKRGPGSIVVATDSYFVSNEALVRDRQPELLAWLIGSSKTIVFDEAHFGILETPGIAALARKYRLHGGVAALLVLAGLFVWKNSFSLAPPRSAADHSPDVVSGRNAATGFVGLLRRNIPGDRILEVCLEEWRKAFALGSRVTPREKAAVDDIVTAEASLAPRDRDPVGAAQKIHAALHHTPAKSHT